ncbi:Hypothetical predicted protein [Mytilus galloprovincialis]|uniref:Peptidase A2 domain-containing protein n=1 Tax=Mytilus galloprovincialis TaxID=29158 RepID=A0A8B6CUZ8_MYTGA|nr:Hypothetical predicted protein [Mytilus galloprovincialis]
MKNPNPDENNKKTVRQVKKNFGPDDSKPNPIPNSNNTEVTEQKSKTLTIKEDELKSLFDKIQEEEKSLYVTNEKSLIPESDEDVEISSKVKDETPQSNKLDIIGRQVVLCDGVYIDGSIQGVKVTFTADTGAARTGEMGPADIKLTGGVILLNGVTIPCIQIGQPEPVRKVRAADNFIIHPQSEIRIDVFVDKTENDPIFPPQDYLIEPSPKFIENHPVMMASSLVDICHDVTNKVILINPFDPEVQINQDTVVGLAEKASEGRSEREHEAIANLLHKYTTAFSAHETDLGMTHFTEHSIDTGDARPIKQASRRVPLAFGEEERKIITQMLDQGVIEHSCSP